MTRRQVAAAAAVIASLAFASPAGAAVDAYGHDVGGNLPSHVAGENAIVHYSTKPEHGVSAITDEVANHVLAAAERTRPAIAQQFGLPLAADPDGKTDIYIWEWPINGGDAIAKSDNPNAPTSTGHVKIDSSYLQQIQNADDYPQELEDTVAHELAHLHEISVAQYQGSSLDMRMLSEGMASLVAARVTGVPAFIGTPYGYSLNDPQTAYSSWLFFDSVVTDLGAPVILETFQELAQGSEPMPALEAAIARRGSSLASAYATFAVRHASGAWSSAAATAMGEVLEAPKENTTRLPRKSPKKPVELRNRTVAVDHLGTGLVRFEPGRSAANCKNGKLTVTVELPPGAPAPSLVTRTDSGAAPPFASRPFAIKGGEAVVKTRWAACRAIGTVVLVNPSTTADAQRFEVSAEYAPPKR